MPCKCRSLQCLSIFLDSLQLFLTLIGWGFTNVCGRKIDVVSTFDVPNQTTTPNSQLLTRDRATLSPRMSAPGSMMPGDRELVQVQSSFQRTIVQPGATYSSRVHISVPGFEFRFFVINSVRFPVCARVLLYSAFSALCLVFIEAFEDAVCLCAFTVCLCICGCVLGCEPIPWTFVSFQASLQRDDDGLSVGINTSLMRMILSL